MQSRDLVEAHRLFFSANLYDRQGPIARGCRTPPPNPLAKVAKYGKGEGLIPEAKVVKDSAISVIHEIAAE